MSDITESLFGGSSVSTPYSSANAPLFEQLQQQILGLGSGFDQDKALGAYDPNKQLQQSAGILTGFNPASYFQGAQGSFGGAGNLFNQAAGFANADPFGAGGYFKNVLGSDFTDVTKDANLQSALQALTENSQKFVNQNADLVGASASRAAGGIGQGTARTNQLSNLVGQAGSDLSNQQAQLLLGEQARRQGIQQSAAQQGLGFGLKQGEFLGNLASQLGQLGTQQAGAGQAQGNLTLDQSKQLQGIGSLFQQLLQGQTQLPLQQQLALAGLLQGQVTQSPGFLGGLGQFVNNVGSGLGGTGGAAAL